MTGTGTRAGDLHWFALRVSPGKEKLAQIIFERNGRAAAVEISTEFRQRRKTRYQKAREDREYVIANGYVFFGFRQNPLMNEDYDWAWISDYHFAGKWVSLNGMPIQLDRTQTQELLAYKGVGRPPYWKFLRTGNEYDIGDTVLIGAGVFKDHSLVVEDIREGEVDFLIQFLGKRERISIPIQHVYAQYHEEAA